MSHPIKMVLPDTIYAKNGAYLMQDNKIVDLTQAKFEDCCCGGDPPCDDCAVIQPSCVVSGATGSTWCTVMNGTYNGCAVYPESWGCRWRWNWPASKYSADSGNWICGDVHLRYVHGTPNYWWITIAARSSFSSSTPCYCSPGSVTYFQDANFADATLSCNASTNIISGSVTVPGVGGCSGSGSATVVFG